MPLILVVNLPDNSVGWCTFGDEAELDNSNLLPEITAFRFGSKSSFDLTVTPDSKFQFLISVPRPKVSPAPLSR